MGEIKKVPVHVAFIMDGNGRWAKAKGLPRTKGHEEGAASVQAVINTARKTGIKYITLYAFSSENWSRPKLEVASIMDLLKQTLDKFTQDENKDVRLIFSGRRARLPKDILAKLDSVIAATAANKGITVNLALNYGARQEIADAVNKMLAEGKKSVSEDDFKLYLYHNIPDPDLIIRTSGEQRLSNFLLWQAAYSEFYFTDILWPDFKEEQFLAALEEFAQRERRFGTAA